jgi:very-short-patch-repair endonuclease
MAAVLATGPGAAVSHRSAAALWRLLPPAPGPVDISVPTRAGRRGRVGIRVHRPASLKRETITSHRGIPVTTPARTIADLRAGLPAHELRRAVRQAEVLGLALGSMVEGDGTRSELEFRFLYLCRRHRLPTPEVNARIGSMTIDFLWRQGRLIVETDGYRYHRGRAAFEDDRSRDLQLRSMGYEVIRLSHRQVVDQPTKVAAVLKRLLESRPPRPRRD